MALLRIGIVTAILLVLTAGAGYAAVERPNALDHRVDAIPQATLLAQPATMLADPARQDAAEHVLRSALCLPGSWRSSC